LVASLKKSVLELKAQINNIIKDIEKKSNQFLKELDTPFVSEEKIKIAMQSVYQQLENLKLREKDCERLESLVS